ncbi:MAG: hypothetical protein AAF541_15805 [Pseudomonadota bacterium]
MRTAELLIAERGLGNVSIRDIVSGAKQKNESALQYHFKNLNGLIDAIHAQRDMQINKERLLVLKEVRETSSTLEVRDIAAVMVLPAYRLAVRHADFRAYIQAFGHEMALASSLTSLASRKSGEAFNQFKSWLQESIPGLDDALFDRRVAAAVRFAAVSMTHQARLKNAFRGQQAEVFVNDLIDIMVGILTTTESPQTRNYSRS